MATETQNLSDEQKDDKAAAKDDGAEGGCADSMAEHFARGGGMKAMAACCSRFAGPGSQSPAGTEADEARAEPEASSSCTKEASR